MAWAETIEDEEFTGFAIDDLKLAGQSFSNCIFRSCTFTEASLQDTLLTECRFEQCEMALINLKDALFHTVVFDTCRLTGVQFGVLQDDAVGITAEFHTCDLSYASFRKLDLRSCAFRSCNAREAEFYRCDLSKVDFQGTDFAGATFQDNNLIEADFRGSHNYVISAHQNRLRGLRVELPEALGLLVGIEVRLHT